MDARVTQSNSFVCSTKDSTSDVIGILISVLLELEHEYKKINKKEINRNLFKTKCYKKLTIISSTRIFEASSYEIDRLDPSLHTVTTVQTVLS